MTLQGQLSPLPHRCDKSIKLVFIKIFSAPIMTRICPSLDDWKCRRNKLWMTVIIAASHAGGGVCVCVCVHGCVQVLPPLLEGFNPFQISAVPKSKQHGLTRRLASCEEQGILLLINHLALGKAPACFRLVLSLFWAAGHCSHLPLWRHASLLDD